MCQAELAAGHRTAELLRAEHHIRPGESSSLTAVIHPHRKSNHQSTAFTAHYSVATTTHPLSSHPIHSPNYTQPPETHITTVKVARFNVNG